MFVKIYCSFLQSTLIFDYLVWLNGRSLDDGQPLSRIVPLSPNKLTPYRAVIIMRLIILGLFFHYRITNPVDSAYALWLTSVICEIWFAVSWVLDQFPKWSPIMRETFIDRLSARYAQIAKITNIYNGNEFLLSLCIGRLTLFFSASLGMKKVNSVDLLR